MRKSEQKVVMRKVRRKITRIIFYEEKAAVCLISSHSCVFV
jgi:hypothetical protein